MLKKLLFFISLVIFLKYNFFFAEIIPLKKPSQTKKKKNKNY